MRTLLRKLLRDENGMIISAELVLVVTIGVLGMIVGINAVAGSINNEMNDIASAFGAINQSYSYRGMTKFGHATVVGSGYVDARDYCDCSVIVPNVGVSKRHGGYVAPPAYHHHVPRQVAPCDNCPKGAHPHKLTPRPDHHLHHHKGPKHHPHPKHPPKKPRKKTKGPKFKK